MALAVFPARSGEQDPGATVEAAIRLDQRDGATVPRIGERVRLLLRLEIPAGFQVGTPRLAGDPAHLVLLEIGKETGGAAPDGGLVKEVPLIVVPFQVGKVEVSGVVVPWSGPEGSEGVARTGELILEVEPTVLDTESAAPADIRSPAGLPVPGGARWLVALLVALTAAVLAAWWWRRRSRQVAPAGQVPPDPFGGLCPADWALEALDRLVREDTLGRQGAETYHVRLAEIVRRYLAGQFQMDALEHTTTEILDGVESRLRPPPGTRTRLRQILAGCDLVKFARFLPGRREALALAGTARQFVEETRPPERPVGETS
jgi:hypothetical protein